jgi:chromosome segregation ATPase
MSISVDTINLRFNVNPKYDQHALNELQDDLKATEKEFKKTAKEVEQSAKEYTKLNDQLKNMKDNRDRLAAQKTRTAEEDQQLERLNKRIIEHNTKVQEQNEKHGKLLDTYRSQTLSMQQAQQKLDAYTSKIGLNKLSLNDLTQKQKELNIVIRQLSPGTDDFIQYTAELKEVTEQIEKTKKKFMVPKKPWRKVVLDGNLF